jgi:hypothetical protein
MEKDRERSSPERGGSAVVGSVKVIEGVEFVERLEALYSSDGLGSVTEYVARELRVGTIVDLGLPEQKAYRICDLAVWRMDLEGTVSNVALLAPRRDRPEFCGLIRVFAVPHVAEPFQIELYGEKVV